MAQHDYVIANQTFPNTRSDINSALAAIVSQNSGSSAPSTTYAYQLWYDTSNNQLKIRNADNDAFITLFTFNQSTDSVQVSGEEVVDDTSPQLGGDLDVQTFSIVSTSNQNVTIAPNGTGDVALDADTVRVGDQNANATITTNGTGDITINTNNGTNSGSIVILDGTNGNITITPNGTGSVVIDGLSYPQADGSAGHVLKTDGAGNLAFADPTTVEGDPNAIALAIALG